MQTILFRLLCCLFVFSGCLYAYQHQQNKLTRLKIALPQLEKELGVIQEENLRLQYEIERIESPIRLIELVHRPEFAHLKHPLMKDILVITEDLALQETLSSKELW